MRSMVCKASINVHQFTNFDSSFNEIIKNSS